MAILNRYKGVFFCGGFVEFTYSPLHKDKMQYWDRRPLALFMNYNNANPSGNGPYISCVNLHWLTIPQRRKLIKALEQKYGVERLAKLASSNKPIPGLDYDTLRSMCPFIVLAWRRYFPKRIRDIRPLAWSWDKEEIKNDLINSDTMKIIGVSSEDIQKEVIKNMVAKKKAKAVKK